MAQNHTSDLLVLLVVRGAAVGFLTNCQQPRQLMHHALRKHCVSMMCIFPHHSHGHMKHFLKTDGAKTNWTICTHGGPTLQSSSTLHVLFPGVPPACCASVDVPDDQLCQCRPHGSQACIALEDTFVHCQL